MLGSVDSKPEPLLDREGQIDARLEAIRARLTTLSERNRDTLNVRAISSGERLEVARRHLLQSRAAATSAMAAAVRAFGTAAEAHERVARVHARLAVSGTGDVREHERQAARHRAAAQADRQRAGVARSLLSDLDWLGRAVVCGEPGDGGAL